MPKPLSRAIVRRWLSRTRVFVGVAVLSILAGCATTQPTIPKPLRPPVTTTSQNDVLESAGVVTRKRPLVEQEPGMAPAATPGAQKPATGDNAPIPAMPRKRPVTLVFDSVPLEAFIRSVFGMELGFDVQIDPALKSRTDLLSLSLRTPEPPAKVYVIARKVLSAYGVEINELGGVLHFVPAKVSAGGELPALIATRSLPQVPAGERTVFVAMPLEVARPGAVAAQVRALFGTNQVKFTEMIDQNALLISGPGDAVRAAMEAVKVLDSDGLIGKRSLRINPLYVSVDVLSKELARVLAGQGITVKTEGNGGAVSLVPVDSANALLVFSDSERVQQLVEQWASRLDQPTEESAGDGIYMYSARYTTVETLLPVLQALLGTGQSSAMSQQGNPDAAIAASATNPERAAGMAASSRGGGQSASANQAQTITAPGVRVAVDPIRNVIIFQGDPRRWRALRSILARLDQPARQVVIEVTVAEVTLTNEFDNGVEWALRNLHVGGMSGPVTALSGATSGFGAGAGLTWQAASSSGQVKALLNLFAKDSRVTILSTPRILVKSGDSASIDVGTEVPTITSQATAPDLPVTGGTASILQSVQYRKTGVLMDITAVVHSSQRVDLKISQEVSEASATTTSSISSPSIFSRKLTTSLSLADGESTLLGGLISSNQTNGNTKVPFLGDIPILGHLFRSESRQGTRTELLMLITPYVVENAAQTRAITDAIRGRFEANEAARPSEP